MSKHGTLSFGGFDYKTETQDGLVYFVPLDPKAPEIRPTPVGRKPRVAGPHGRRRTRPQSIVECIPEIVQKAEKYEPHLPLIMPVFPYTRSKGEDFKPRFYVLCEDGKLRSVRQCWAMLFIMNEYLPANEKMDEAEILERMSAFFPMRKDFDIVVARRDFNHKKSPVHSYCYEKITAGMVEDNPDLDLIEGDILVYAATENRKIGMLSPTDPPGSPLKPLKSVRMSSERMLSLEWKRNQDRLEKIKKASRVDALRDRYNPNGDSSEE